MKLNQLRPVFFRVGKCLETTHSGWVDPKTLNIWAFAEDAYAIGESCVASDAVTAASLLGLEANAHGLVLIPHATLALTIGERVVFTREVDLFPVDVIEAHERAVVGRRDRITGAVELFLEGFHPKLAEEQNCLMVTPHGASDILGAIRPYGDQWTAKTFVDLEDFRAG